MFQEIYIIDENRDLIEELEEMFQKDNELKMKSIAVKDLDTVLRGIPDLIIIDEDDIEENVVDVCKRIRQNEDNSITPIIVISSNQDTFHALSIIENSIEYYIQKPVTKEYLYYTIKNIIRLLYVNRRVSPLTGLPGNVQIQTELKKRLLKKEPFVVLYFDLDNFKAYNDVYGFLKGDNIIQLTAKLITKNIHDAEEGKVFVGHIGGDDFVAILDGTCNYDKVCQDIISEFDIEVVKLFNEDDIARGYLNVENRKGIMEHIPLTSISIGVVVADGKRFANVLEIGEIGAQVKHLAKITMGSCYAIDRREAE